MIRTTVFGRLSRASFLHLASRQSSVRAIMTLQDHLYASKAIAEPPGRCGLVSSNGDAPLSLTLSRPKSIGGKSQGQTPEQLLAMGYSSCFLSALEQAASKENKNGIAANAKVYATVFFGHPTKEEGFGLAINITVEGVDDDQLILLAHEMCPFSRALRDGVQIKILKI